MTLDIRIKCSDVICASCKKPLTHFSVVYSGTYTYYLTRLMALYPKSRFQIKFAYKYIMFAYMFAYMIYLLYINKPPNTSNHTPRREGNGFVPFTESLSPVWPTPRWGSSPWYHGCSKPRFAVINADLRRRQ